MEDAIEQLRQEVQVLRESLDELTAVFEHAINNGRVVIQVDLGISVDEEPVSARGDGDNEPSGSREPSEQGASKHDPPIPGRLF